MLADAVDSANKQDLQPHSASLSPVRNYQGLGDRVSQIGQDLKPLKLTSRKSQDLFLQKTKEQEI